jgi:signal transduction histidine kinase
MSEEQLVGRGVRDLTYAGDRVRTSDVLRSSRSDPEYRSFDLEKRYLRADGSAFWARSTGSRVDPTSSRPGYWFVQISDITARRNFEETERLATVGRLAAGVAHEINNPLTYVLFELESLGRTGLTGRPAESVANALSGSKRIARIVRDLKTFSRSGAEETFEAVDLSRVVEVVLEMSTAEVKHRAQIVLRLTSGTLVRATEARIAQVLLNLVINAAHAIGEGNLERDEIEVRTFTDGDWAYVTVRDTGVGIAPDDQRRIFEPFFTTKGAGVGSGLGLSISAAIVESYGGSIAVTSDLGRGSVFTVRLPAYQGEQSVRTKVAAPIVTPAASRARVLVVDDEPMVLRAFALSLEADFDVLTAGAAAEAREHISRNGPFDAVVCDLMMPGESGSEFYGWLCAAHPELARRTIFVTGGAFTPRAQALIASVPNAVLEKPFDFQRLRGLIASLRATPPRG